MIWLCLDKNILKNTRKREARLFKAKVTLFTENTIRQKLKSNGVKYDKVLTTRDGKEEEDIQAMVIFGFPNVSAHRRVHIKNP